MRPKKVITMGIPPLRIDVLTNVTGVEFRACYPNRLPAVIDGINVAMISLTDLKRNKTAAARPKDLDDLQNLP